MVNTVIPRGVKVNGVLENYPDMIRAGDLAR